VFMLIELAHFLGKKSLLKLKFTGLRDGSIKEIVKVGMPGVLGDAYQTVRGIILNALILTYAGSAGMSAQATVNSFLGMFWTIPAGMLTVSRMLMSVSIGEKDRMSLKDVMYNMLKWSVPLMSIVAIALALLAEPLTNLYYHDPSQNVYQMTVWGFRLMPLVMPIAVIAMHGTCYAQTSGKIVLVHIMSVMDGVVGVVISSLILMPLLSINGFYIANILNSVITVLIVVVYSIIINRRSPRNMDELMVIPKDFGVNEDERMDLSVNTMDEVISVSISVMEFCESKGIDRKRSHLAGLCLEEMAGNVISHGFKKRRGPHSVDIRVVHSEDSMILRIKDDCVPFNPAERKEIMDPEDKAKNIGIRMVYGIAEKVEYQNILGMNVLTIHI